MGSFRILSFIKSHLALFYMKQFCCSYTTKNKKAFSIIRWNAENKILYGAKRNDDTKNKESTKSAPVVKPSLLLKKNYSTEDKKAKRKKSVIDEGKRHVHSKQEFSSLLYDNVKENDFEDEWLETESKFDDTFKTGAVEERIMNMQLRVEDDSSEVSTNNMYSIPTILPVPSPEKWLAEERSEKSAKVSTNNMYSIPTILPVPGREKWPAEERSEKSASFNQALKPAERNKTHVHNISVKKENELSSAQAAILNYVLQFPLFPSNVNSQQRLSAQADEFKDMVEACKLRFLPTVNVILNKTRSDLGNFFLQRWREKMIKELGEAGFKKHQEEVIWQGTNFHACVQQYLSGVPLSDIQIPEKNRGHWKSISAVLSDVSEIQALETSVFHPFLYYKGTFDCVAKYKNTLCIFDWKTSDKAKPLLSNLYDNPLQVAAYLGALNACPDFTAKFGSVEHAAIVVAYTNGETAHMHRMSPAICQHYWTQWCQRLHQYWSIVVAEKVWSEVLVKDLLTSIQ